MMEWSPEQVQTVGGVFAAMLATFGLIIMGVFKAVGQRTEPGLMTFLNTFTQQTGKNDERIAAVIENLTTAIGQYSTDVKAMKQGVETVFSSIVKLIESNDEKSTVRQTEVLNVWGAFKESMRTDHEQAYGAILKIAPKIEELRTAQAATEKQSEGFKKVVDEAMTTQSKTNGEILKALQRIEQTLNDIKREFPERIEKVEQDVNALKADINKSNQVAEKVNEITLKSEPSPANQPIVRPKPLTEPKEEKENNDAV
jgi:DNA repair exonuclease SbcCD ATPase subunit